MPLRPLSSMSMSAPPTASLTAARQRGTGAAQQRLGAQVLRLAVLGGGAEPAALTLWLAEQAAAKEQLDSAVHGIRHLLRNVAGAMPPLDEGSDSDEEEDARAAHVQRFRAALAAEGGQARGCSGAAEPAAAAGGAG